MKDEIERFYILVEKMRCFQKESKAHPCIWGFKYEAERLEKQVDKMVKQYAEEKDLMIEGAAE